MADFLLTLLRRWLFALLLLLPGVAFADLGLVLADATPFGASRWTQAGHSAVYLSRICAAGPVKMRLCQAGETGSVISNLADFNEDREYDWNIVPASIYFYGVDDDEARPLIASHRLKAALEERFLVSQLRDICSGPCGDDRHARWRDLVAGSFNRGYYLFTVNTTVEQDVRLIAKFNARANINRYNGFSNNCADFAADIVNTYFPHAARTDHLNDFGMTSPKAISKSFVHYARRHPELELRISRIPQLPGDFAPSSDARKGTEVAFRSKRWLLPMLLRSHELAYCAASYMLTGRFNPAKEMRRSPSEEVARLQHELMLARREHDADSVRDLTAQMRQARRDALGTSDDWRSYRTQFASEIAEAEMAGIPAPTARQIARDIDRPHPATQTSTSADPQLAYRLMLAHLRAQMNANSRSRESLSDMALDWKLLDSTREAFLRESARRDSAAAAANGVDNNSDGNR